MTHQFCAVSQQVDVQHVSGLDVDHEVPGAGEGRLARNAVEPFCGFRGSAAGRTVVVASLRFCKRRMMARSLRIPGARGERLAPDTVLPFCGFKGTAIVVKLLLAP